MKNILSSTEFVQSLGGCTEDPSSCQLLSTASELEGSSLGDTVSQEIRDELSRVACGECREMYLADIVEGSSSEETEPNVDRDLPPAPEMPWGPKLHGRSWRNNDKKPFVGWQ